MCLVVVRELIIGGMFANRNRHSARGMSVYCIGVWEEMRMGYIAREPIIRGIFAAQHTQGQA